MTFQRIGLFTSGLFLYSLSAYAGFHLYKLYKLPNAPCGADLPENQPSVVSRYKILAHDYDAKIDWDEFVMGLGSKRKSLLALAKVIFLKNNFKKNNF
jgi:methyltransferase OMS1